MHPENEFAMLSALMEKGQLEKAIRVADRFISAGGNRDLGTAFVQKMEAQIALGLFTDALATALLYKEYCYEFSRNKFPISGNVFLSHAYWLNQQRDDAIRTLVDEIEGLKCRRLTMADGSGGAGLGIRLLHYGLVHEDSRSQKIALDWMRAVLSKASARNWPGPLASFLLDEISLPDALIRMTDLIGGSLEEVIATAQKPRGRYEAHQVLFCLAVKARFTGDEPEARRWLKLLAETPSQVGFDIQQLAVLESV